MKLEECIKRIDRYLRSTDTQPRFVNVQNINDLAQIKQHFHVGSNKFKQVQDYCKEDENPSMDSLLNGLRHMEGVVFLTGFTTHLMLMGEYELKNQLSKLIHLTTTSCRIVVLCYQCEKYLTTSDVRFDRIIYSVDGEKSKKPRLVFFSPEMPAPQNGTVIDGIQNAASAIEEMPINVVYIKTRKNKSSYSSALYHISEQNGAFDVLCTMDPHTNQLSIDYGTENNGRML
ncbi:DUF7864 domain-containing protein [Anaerovorax sp. IOR16]|uniref:DUF7864 domain-containing protein n=1 Tax=Anaerovorax sp. IOR16 TaxID=2773458 RepID=UPI0019CFBF60|nr:hypothetical protein [Anaerovorax sp. IOR16]